MNDNQNVNIPPAPSVPPRPGQLKQRKSKTPWLIAGGALLLMTFGFGMGQASAIEDNAEPVAEPETITETETVTETVETTNPACIEALDSADTLMDLLLDAIDISSEAIGNAAEFDWDALDGNTAELEEITPQVGDARSDYDTASLECRLGDS